MTHEEAKNFIVRLVTEVQGAKATEIASYEELIGTDPPAIIEELINEGSLVEVEYVLPSLEYRCKSFLLPKGTKVRVNDD